MTFSNGGNGCLVLYTEDKKEVGRTPARPQMRSQIHAVAGQQFKFVVRNQGPARTK